jgi:phage repressor protein C with HTH and peptisase S24 domain
MHEGVYPMMGDGGESNGTEVVTLVRVAEETLRRRLAASAYSGLRNLRLVTARGVSMAPTFQPGDVLIVDSAVNDVREDGIYVFSREDELFVKRLQRSVDGSLMVISDNPLHAQDRIERERLGAYRIHGRVLSSWNFHVHS